MLINKNKLDDIKKSGIIGRIFFSEVCSEKNDDNSDNVEIEIESIKFINNLDYFCDIEENNDSRIVHDEDSKQLVVKGSAGNLFFGLLYKEYEYFCLEYGFEIEKIDNSLEKGFIVYIWV